MYKERLINLLKENYPQKEKEWTEFLKQFTDERIESSPMKIYMMFRNKAEATYSADAFSKTKTRCGH